jgi:hypothetical protein
MTSRITLDSTRFGSGNRNIADDDFSAYHRDQVVNAGVDTVAAFRLIDWDFQKCVLVREKGAIYTYDAASTASDNGDTVLHDNLGRRYLKGAFDGAAVPGADGAPGGSFSFEFDGASQTMADPGPGLFRLNNATPESATAMALAADLADTTDVSALVMARLQSSASIKARLVITSGSNRLEFEVTAATDNTAWIQLTLDSGAIVGTIADEATCDLVFFETGEKGAAGDPGSSDVVGTSTTSLAIGTGTKTFTIAETDRGWGVGARLKATSDANAANFMSGLVTAYSGTTLELSVDLVGGSGTLDDWTINLAGERGAPGADGLGTGDMVASTYDPNAVAADAFDMDNMVEGTDTKIMTAAERTKVGHLSVSGAVDLDAINTRVNELDAAVVLKGAWDASAGTFPGSGSAQAGWSYIVSVAGTVDGVAFSANDRIIAILDDASTTTYSANWLKLDYTDLVSSINGETGAITDVLKADTPDVLTAGFSVTDYNFGTKSSGTFTPDLANGNHQYGVNGGAHTLSPPTSGGYVKLLYTNNSSAGVITLSGFDLEDGDPFTTTDGDEFFVIISKINGKSFVVVKKLP